MSKNSKTVSSIGTQRESSLHRSLKFRYSPDVTETLVEGYVCDGINDKQEIIEVQTGSFGPLKDKVKDLAKKRKVRIIHPIIAQKHIELYDCEGRLLHRRKSPRNGSAWDLFKALVYAPDLPLLKNLTIELAVVEVTEKRVSDGTGSWRRKGARIADRFLCGHRHSVVLKKPKDYYQFVPFRNEPFTVRDLAEKAGINASLSRKALYTLAKIGLVERAGTRGRAFIYVKKQNKKNLTPRRSYDKNMRLSGIV
jgi:hypothetical protein